MGEKEIVQGKTFGSSVLDFLDEKEEVLIYLYTVLSKEGLLESFLEPLPSGASLSSMKDPPDDMSVSRRKDSKGGSSSSALDAYFAARLQVENSADMLQAKRARELEQARHEKVQADQAHADFMYNLARIEKLEKKIRKYTKRRKTPPSHLKATLCLFKTQMQEYHGGTLDEEDPEEDEDQEATSENGEHAEVEEGDVLIDLD
jgi:hypothetical protein